MCSEASLVVAKQEFQVGVSSELQAYTFGVMERLPQIYGSTIWSLIF